MKKTRISLFAVVVSLLLTGPALAAVVSERGNLDITAESAPPPRTKQEIVQGGFGRSYKQQPPMIPHKIDKEEISLKLNTCLKCHSEKTYQARKAPKAGDSHYFDRDGKQLETISSRRWFCNQCHAPQEDAKPLVENTFEGLQ